jgi:hypothetical protein
MLFDDPSNLTPDEILDWLGLCSHGLELTRQEVRAAALSGALPPGIAAGSLVGLNLSEIEAYFDSCQTELDLFAVLALIASIEAKIRVDAGMRHLAKGNQLSGRLSVLFSFSSPPWKVPLYDGGILDEWKRYIQNEPSIPVSDRRRMIGDIGRYKDLLPIRHWIGHGRYWPLQRAIKSYPPHAVATAIENLHGTLVKAAGHGNLAPFV